MTDAKEISPVIRYATESDAVMLTELAARTFWDTFAEYNRPEDMEAYMSAAFTVARVSGEVADPRSVFLVAEIGGAAAGYAKLHAGETPPCVTGPRPVELERLYVSRDYLGAGVGQRLMQACLDEARRRSYETLFLGVWEHNERAKAFYLKHGFKFVGEHVFVLGEDRQTDLLMERAL